MMNIRRPLAAAALTLLAALPAAAQGNDPDVKAKGGALPAGWTGRTDRPNTKLDDVKFVTMGTGYHITTGPAAIFWKREHDMTGPFTATATMTQTKAPAHPEAYGVFFMGSKLDTPEQSYAYVVVRGNGDVLVKHRAGAEIHTIQNWAPNAAVHKQDASGKATNTFRIVAGADSLRVQVNGTQVFALAASYASGNGYVGLRVNHNLDVHVDEFTVTPARTAAAAKAGTVKATAKKAVAKKAVARTP